MADGRHQVGRGREGHDDGRAGDEAIGAPINGGPAHGRVVGPGHGATYRPE